jgi:UDP:flavonoid glycosyltransferase YjiC (YdhE family)
MRVVLSAGGSQNHLDSLFALGLELRRRGHQVLLAVSPEQAGSIRGSELDFLVTSPEPAVETVLTGAAGNAPNSPRVAVTKQWQASVAIDSDTGGQTLDEICSGADMLVGPPDDHACLRVCQEHAIPYVSLRGVESELNGREDPSCAGPAPNRDVLCLHAVSRHLIPQSSGPQSSGPQPWESREKGHAVGFMTAAQEDQQPPDQALVEWCHEARPLVIVSISSGAGSDALAKIAVETARQLGYRMVIQWPGWKPEQPLVESVYVTGHPFRGWLFSRADLVVHDGGVEAAMSAFRAGCPVVIVPGSSRQSGLSEAARAMGCVKNIIPLPQLNAARLSAAIRGTLGSPEIKSAAAALGERIRKENGAEEAAKLMEEFALRRHQEARQGNGNSHFSAAAPAPEQRTGKPLPPLVKLDGSRERALSYAQQRLWFLWQLNPENAAYNMPGGLRMAGKLDRDALQRTFDEIVRRHEVLRTSFPAGEGKPVQQITPAAPAHIEYIDLRGLPENEREAQARTLALEEVKGAFDLAQGPLFRIKLLQLAEQEHVLLLTMHHVISDGWSIRVLMREVSTLYAAFIQGLPSPLEELPIQYADFSAWQQSWLTGEVLEQELNYWKQQLKNLAVLHLPMDHPRPPQLTSNGAMIRVAIPAEVVRKLKMVVRSNTATLFMGFMAAFQMLLGRYAMQNDVAVGTPIANRKQKDVEPLIGFFANTLVMRTHLSPAMTFQELLQQVKERTLGAYAHQDVPFEKLVEALQPRRDMSRSPFFQVMLTLQNIEKRHLDLPGLKLSDFMADMDQVVAKFDLMLALGESEEGLTGTLEYNTDLYEEETARGMRSGKS